MTVREIKERYRLRETMEGYGIEIKRNGFCRCPFHQGDNTPSMKIYPNDTYNCFGCGANGDVISFVMQMDGLSFKEACQRLSGETLSGETRNKVAVSKERRKARENEALRRKDALNTIRHRISYYRDKMRELEPKSPEEMTDEFAEAVREFTRACQIEELIIDGLYKP